MPAAAVIPAPIVYTNVVAVKKLVVGFLVACGRAALTACVARGLLGTFCDVSDYFEQIRVLKAGVCLE